MSTLVIVLRSGSLLAFAGPMILRLRERRREAETPTRQIGTGRAPVVANLTAFGVFFPSLLIFSGSSQAFLALPRAMSGCLVAVAGAAIVLRARTELGAAWSFVPKADESTGLVTTGPYRFMRHPVYLGLTLLVLGQALAFSSSFAGAIVPVGIVSTFAWRAGVEETLLRRTFGEAYVLYRRRTKMLVPHLF